MGLLFQDELHDAFGSWPLAYIPYGGADFGEVLAVARAVGNGGDAEFCKAWVAAGDRLTAEAEAALSRGKQDSARELYLRASAFYATSYHPLYGKPVDPQLVGAHRKQVAAFDAGCALAKPAVIPFAVPFEGHALPAYLLPAEAQAEEVRPLLILTSGYDSSITDGYFASAVAASRRGYHCLLFDGPGQGSMLIEHGIPLRPDWENVIRAVVDVAVTLPTVDRARIALSGWSLGGYLAPRAASGEPRLAACIADPGSWGMRDSAQTFAIKLGAQPAEVAELGEIAQPLLDRMWSIISGDRKLRWSIVQRGFWANGASDLRGYLRAVQPFTMDGRAERITCPTLLTTADNDPLAAGAEVFLERLHCPKALLRFTTAEGAGDHCEMNNRSLLNRRVLDWLDDVLA